MHYADRSIIVATVFILSLLLTTGSHAQQSKAFDYSTTLKNIQINTPMLISSGLPNKADFEALQLNGVGRVIDLIPGDRSAERALVTSMGLEYFNVQVEWENPTLQNFKDYVHYMTLPGNRRGKTLTHCKLNWRGSAFMYLYRVTQLNEPDTEARADMEEIWQPDATWQAFIDNVKAEYRK